MKLLVDVGNTRVKWGLWDNGELTSVDSVSHSAFDDGTLDAAWKAVAHAVTAVWYVNVAGPRYDDKIQALSQTVFSLQPKRAVSQAAQCGVINAYEQPEHLGADRWLSLLAVSGSVNAGVCVVSAGTAVTIDLLAQDGRHLGGFILPGLSLMIQALNMHTHGIKVADFSTDYRNPAATNTVDAVSRGALMAVVGAIERVMADFQANGQLSVCILSGGDAERIKAQLRMPTKIVPNLVLHGLGKVADSV